jgi:hypothetical protein
LFGMTDVVDENDDDGNRTTTTPTSTHNNDNRTHCLCVKDSASHK